MRRRCSCNNSIKISFDLDTNVEICQICDLQKLFQRILYIWISIIINIQID